VCSSDLHKAFGRYCKEKGNHKIGVIHFDSHADICDTYDNHKWSHACTERRTVEDVISPADLAYVGLRSYEIEELEYFELHPEILVIKAYDVFKEGYIAAYKKLADRFQDYDAVYFTLDIDVLDPAYAPGTGTPEAGGLSSREMIELTKLMITNLPIKAMDIVEVSPPLDQKNNITSWTALKIIYEVFGCLNDKEIL
jgi:agmatinase